MSKRTPIEHKMDELINLEKRKLKKQVFDVINKLDNYDWDFDGMDNVTDGDFIKKEELRTEMEKVFK